MIHYLLQVKKTATIFRKYLFLFLLIFVFNQASVAQENGYVSGELILMLPAHKSISDFRTEFSSIGDTSTLSTTLLSYSIPVYLVRHPQLAGNEATILDRIQSFRSIQAAQFNYLVQPRLLPDDTNFGDQWGMNNTGQAGGTPDADVDAPEAWNTTTGGLTAAGDTIVVAVVDGGVQLTHPDLLANLWTNYAEVAGNGIDDDANGYIDDVNGWNAYNNTGTLPLDAHGTHVAGIIGARGNNTTGVTGINWKVKIMNIAGSSGNTATVITAYSYALQQRRLYNTSNGAQGAFVVAVNSSFGVDFGLPANYPIWCAFYDTMGAAGILNVAATANANTNVDVQGDIPTACPSNYLVTVTNSTRADLKNASAGYGVLSIDLGAPGTTIYSTLNGSTYGNLTGTSMATPMVAGIIGLMYSYPCVTIGTLMHQNPASFALLVKEALLDGVDDLPAFAANTVSGGRANARRALDSMAVLCSFPLPLGLHSFDAHSTGCTVRLNWSGSEGQDMVSFAIEGSRDGLSFTERGVVKAEQAAQGRYHFTIREASDRYYRLRLNNRDHTIKYSPVAAVSLAGCNRQQTTIYPNPLSGNQLIVEGIKEGQQLYFSDVYGKIVLQIAVHSDREQLEVSQLPPGLYFLQVREGNSIIARHKLIRW